MSSETLKGRRVIGPVDAYPCDIEPTLQPGDYAKWRMGLWLIVTPNGLHGSLRDTIHTIIEHDDGTITVSPSILVSLRDNLGTKSWHGYLERGIWRDCP
jgi:hypothetical protein